MRTGSDRHDRPLAVPPGRHLLIDPDERLVVIETGTPPPHRPSGDLLLATMATVLNERAVAVVLSGHGRDAATGATAIHERGGTVLASDAETSTVFAMPQATIERDDAVDAAVPLADIASLLTAMTGATAR